MSTPFPRTKQFRSRANNELSEFYQKPDIIKVIKAGRLRWAGHVHRQPDSIDQNILGKEQKSLRRPRMRWRDNIVPYLRAMEIEYAFELMQDREREGWDDRTVSQYPECCRAT